MSKAQWQAERPPLTRELEQVLHVWNFCAGWAPHLVPIAALYYGVSDVDRLFFFLLHVRACIDRHDAAE